ncbi:MAG: hypothetical protein ACLQOO_20340 [Terriglobia bacterium]
MPRFEGESLGTVWLIRRAQRRTDVGACRLERSYLVIPPLVAALSFAVSLVITYWSPFVAFPSLHTRVWQLALGGLAALTADQRRRLPPLPAAITGWAGLPLILLVRTRLSSTTPAG